MENDANSFAADWGSYVQEDSEIAISDDVWYDFDVAYSDLEPGQQAANFSFQESDNPNDILQLQDTELNSYADNVVEISDEEDGEQPSYENWIAQGYTVDLSAEFDPKTGNYATGLQPNSLGCDKTDYDGSQTDNVKVGFSGLTGAGGAAVGWALSAKLALQYWAVLLGQFSGVLQALFSGTLSTMLALMKLSGVKPSVVISDRTKSSECPSLFVPRWQSGWLCLSSCC
ncbi:hypothetical protein [Gloeobacter violaceus]|nr:hypothetical protein [Gloeobacter violaceus]